MNTNTGNTNAEMNYNSKGVISASEELSQLSDNITSLISSTLTNTIKRAQEVYKSDSADKLSELNSNIMSKLPEFNENIEKFSKFLSDVVAPSYHSAEQSIGSSVDNISLTENNNGEVNLDKNMASSQTDEL